MAPPSGSETPCAVVELAGGIHLARQAEPPLRFVAGADAAETVEQKAKNLLAQLDEYRGLSTSLSLDELEIARRRS